MSYFQDIQTGIRTTLKGLSLTWRHLRNATKRRTPEGIANDNYFDLQNGLVTLQYPHEQLPIPDNGRYQLRNEIKDCIVCDKCAKICPVDCITIDAIKATEEVGRASDGSPIRLYAAKFDIDMAKCCYCGLCTVVCPTECLTMDKKFDYSEFDLGKLTYNFSNLTPEQADEKRTLYEQFLREKEDAKAAQVAAKAAAQPVTEKAINPAASPARPVFRPMAKPVVKTPPAEPANSEGSSIEHPLTDASPEEMQQIAQGGLETQKHPVFEPTQKPKAPVTAESVDVKQAEGDSPADQPVTPKPAVKSPGFRPSMKPAVAKMPAPEPVEPVADESSTEQQTPVPPTKPAGFRPTMKLPVKEPDPAPVSEAPAAKSAFRPTMKPAVPAPKPEPPQTDAATPEAPAPPKLPAFRPTMKPAKPVEDSPAEQSEAAAPEVPKPKPSFRPTMKPATAIPKSDDATPEPEKPVVSAEAANDQAEPPVDKQSKLKPAFRPTMKPKPKADNEESE